MRDRGAARLVPATLAVWLALVGAAGAAPAGEEYVPSASPPRERPADAVRGIGDRSPEAPALSEEALREGVVLEAPQNPSRSERATNRNKRGNKRMNKRSGSSERRSDAARPGNSIGTVVPPPGRPAAEADDEGSRAAAFGLAGMALLGVTGAGAALWRRRSSG